MNKNDRESMSRLGPLFGGKQIEVRTGPEPAEPGARDVALWKPGNEPTRGSIRVGTSGYSFRDWVGPFYPRGTQQHQMLPYYAARFPTVEINVTYYRLPGPRVFEQIEKKTPRGFEFFVKLHGPLTHERTGDAADVEEFCDSVQPLAATGKYKGALAQFPFSFHNNDASRDYLSWLADTYTLRPLVVEFRHDSWNCDETYELLEEKALDFSCVDEPQLQGLFPPVTRLTGDTGYVRMHGRNEKTWWEGQGSERYNYLYSQKELQDWVDKVRELASQARATYVFFNNCHAGRAIQNARMMGELLNLSG